jgi:signal transduction histidine kinase
MPEDSQDNIRKLSHDVRNCIHALRTAVDLLRSNPHPVGDDQLREQQEIVSWMEHDIARASQLVERLIAAANGRGAGSDADAG